MKELVRNLASRVVVSSGFSSVARQFADRQGTLILYGHRVSGNNEGYLQGLSPEWLDEQVAYLARHYEIISLTTLVDCLAKRQPPPKRSVVLTFDDGFKDNLTEGLRVLQKHRAPATIFVVTGSLTHGDLPWSQRLGFVFQQTNEPCLRHPKIPGGEAPLRSAAQRLFAYQSIKKSLISIGREDRDRQIAQVAQTLRVEPPKDRMLSWDDTRMMMSHGIEIGAHTFSHPLLGKIDPNEAEWEICKSRDDLKENLGIDRPSFCFPAGSWNPKLLKTLPSLGFRSAFVPDKGIRINHPSRVDEFSMARLGLPNAPGFMLEAELDGPFHFIRKFFSFYATKNQAA